MNCNALKMKLKPGRAQEYKKRHDEIRPEPATPHSDAGILCDATFFEEETPRLFAFQMRVIPPQSMVGIEDSGAGVVSILLAGFAPIGIAGGNIIESGTRSLCVNYEETFERVLARIQ